MHPLHKLYHLSQNILYRPMPAPNNNFFCANCNDALMPYFCCKCSFCQLNICKNCTEIKVKKDKKNISICSKCNQDSTTYIKSNL